MPDNIRTCTKCGVAKSRAEFPVDRSRRDGVLARCRYCYNAELRARYKPTPRPVSSRVCSRPDCNRPHLARGFCRSHYYRDRRRQGLEHRSVSARIGALITTPAGTTVARVVAAQWTATGGIVACGYRGHPGPQPVVLFGRDGVARCDCGSRIALNVEEIQWETYEQRSIAA